MRNFTLVFAAALVAGACSRDKIVDPTPAPLSAKDAETPGSDASITSNVTTPADAESIPPDPIAKPPAIKPPTTDVAKVVSGNTQFANELYRLIGKNPGNLFFSPASISTALAMTYAGARGDTATEMQKALHFSLPGAKLHEAYGQLLAELQAADASGPEFRVANRLFGQQSYSFDKSFLDLESTRYGAPLQLVDFGLKTEDARLTINKWVAVQTHDKIPDLLEPGVLEANTRLVLTNAVYFKGTWLAPFEKFNTWDAPFAASTGTKKVPTMHQSVDTQYYETKDAQLVELPYGSGDPNRVFSMTVVLPKPGIDLAQLEAQLDQIDTWSSAMKPAHVKISLPRFKTRSRFELGDALSKLGMPQAFDPAKADFSGMTTSERLWIAHVVHEAFIATDEVGTEAAAATAVTMDGESAGPMYPEQTFNADHPFSVVIRDKKTGTVLFMGRIVDPVS